MASNGGMVKGSLALLLIYHVANWPHWRTVQLPDMERHSLILRAGSRDVLRAEVATPLFKRWVDRASKLAGGAGYTLRYLAGQYPFEMFSSRQGGVLHLYNENQIAFQYASYIPAVRGQTFSGQCKTFIEGLTRRGVEVVIVAAPTHLSMDRTMLGGLPPSSHWDEEVWGGPEDARGVYAAFAGISPLHILDLYGLFEQYQRVPGRRVEEGLFIPSDDHWASPAIALTAKAVLDALRAKGWLAPEVELSALELQPPRYDYQLLSFLQLPGSFLRGRAEFQWRSILTGLKPRDPAWKPSSAARPGRLILAGTSFSKQFMGTPQSLGALLSHFLDRPITEFAVGGGNTEGALWALKKSGFQFHSGDVLVWEFPLHTIMFPRQKAALPEFEVIETGGAKSPRG